MVKCDFGALVSTLGTSSLANTWKLLFVAKNRNFFIRFSRNLDQNKLSLNSALSVPLACFVTYLFWHLNFVFGEKSNFISSEKVSVFGTVSAEKSFYLSSKCWVICVALVRSTAVLSAASRQFLLLHWLPNKDAKWALLEDPSKNTK